MHKYKRTNCPRCGVEVSVKAAYYDKHLEQCEQVPKPGVLADEYRLETTTSINELADKYGVSYKWMRARLVLGGVTAEDFAQKVNGESAETKSVTRTGTQCDECQYIFTGDHCPECVGRERRQARREAHERKMARWRMQREREREQWARKYQSSVGRNYA